MRPSIICFVVGLGVAGAVLAQPNSQNQSEVAKDPGAPGKEQDLAEVLHHILEAQNQAKQNEDLEGILQNVHERMANRQRRTFIKIFRAYDLEYSLDDFKLLYHDQEVAVARVKQTIRRISGPMFKDNRRDGLQVFLRTVGKWQLYELVVLDRVDFETPGLETELPNARPSKGAAKAIPPGAAATQPGNPPATQPTEPPATRPAKKPEKED